MLLEPSQTINILEQNHCEKFAPGQVIFQEGDIGDCLYGVISGEVDLMVNNKVVETIKAGDIFGEGALVQPDHDRGSTAVAKVETKLAIMKRHHFIFAVQETPLFALEIIRSLSTRLRKIKHSITE